MRRQNSSSLLGDRGQFRGCRVQRVPCFTLAKGTWSTLIINRGGKPYSLGVRLTFKGSEFTNAQKLPTHQSELVWRAQTDQA